MTDTNSKAQVTDELRTIAAMITSSNFFHQKQIGDVTGWCQRIQTRLLALAAQEKPEPGVVVKGLEWDEFSTELKRHFQSNTILGQYQIAYLGEFECWQLYSPQKSSTWKENFSRHKSSDDAKAAAQADYEQRIRSALVAPSPDLPEGEVESEIADAVLSWLVKHDLADAGNEYTASDVIEILNDLAPASEDALREAYILGRKGWCPASILEDQERTERDWQKARNRLTTLPTSPSPIDKGEVK